MAAMEMCMRRKEELDFVVVLSLPQLKMAENLQAETKAEFIIRLKHVLNLNQN